MRNKGYEVEKLSKRLRDRIEIDHTSQCWIWKGLRDRAGYGKLGGKLVHRRTYTELVDEIPQGLVSSHLCHNKSCCNPNHIRICTQRENLLERGSRAIAKINSEKTHCPRGHVFAPGNLLYERGNRRCKTCRLAQMRAAYHRKKQAYKEPYNAVA